MQLISGAFKLITSFIFLNGFLTFIPLLGPGLTIATSGNVYKASAQFIINKKLEKEYEKKMLENAEELSKQQVELDAVAAEKQKLIDEMNELKGVKTEKTNSPK